MKKITIIAFLISLVFLSGCGYTEGVKTSSTKSYIYFTGNSKNISVSIDKNKIFDIKTGKNNKYMVSSGKHLVEVYKNGTLVIKREIFISDGISKEIEVQ